MRALIVLALAAVVGGTATCSDGTLPGTNGCCSDDARRASAGLAPFGGAAARGGEARPPDCSAGGSWKRATSSAAKPVYGSEPSPKSGAGAEGDEQRSDTDGGADVEGRAHLVCRGPRVVKGRWSQRDFRLEGREVRRARRGRRLFTAWLV